MKILVLNWRDIKDPKAGGAELLTHEMAKRWVILGHEVEQHNAIYPGASEEDIIDGVRIVRHGNYLTTYLFSLQYVLKNRSKFDVIVEEVHGIPYFLSLFGFKNVVVLALEVAKKHWSLIYSFPLNILGRILEKIYFILYRDYQFLTISKSSMDDLIEEGILTKNISIVPMGLSVTIPKGKIDKEKKPTVMFLGRLAPIKGIEDAIEAVSLIIDRISDLQFWIVGSGDTSYQEDLKSFAKKMGVYENTKFWGFVNEQKKFELLSKAHILLVPSRNEGWGLIVPEAGIVGTPSVVYDVTGLKDIVTDNVDGMVASGNNPKSLAETALKLLDDNGLYGRIRKNMQLKAKSFNWDNTAEVALKILKENVKK